MRVECDLAEMSSLPSTYTYVSWSGPWTVLASLTADGS